MRCASRKSEGRRAPALPCAEPALLRVTEVQREGLTLHDGMQPQAARLLPAVRAMLAAARSGLGIAAIPDYMHADGDGLVQVLGGLLRPKGHQQSAASITRARTMMDDDPTAHWSLAQLADAASLSRYQLVRQFAQATGLTPHAYLLQRRLQLARHLMGEGTPLADVAAASGFADQSHLTRLFTRSFGITPGAYVRARG